MSDWQIVPLMQAVTVADVQINKTSVYHGGWAALLFADAEDADEALDK